MRRIIVANSEKFIAQSLVRAEFLQRPGVGATCKAARAGWRARCAGYSSRLHVAVLVALGRLRIGHHIHEEVLRVSKML